MVTVYVVRHCEAQGNSERRFQGQINSDITNMGLKQLEKLAERFEDIHIDKIYSSPLIRAHKTAAAIADKKAMEIIDISDLSELNVGDFEGITFKEFFDMHTQYSTVWKNNPQDFCAPNGETMKHLYGRIWRAIVDIVNENSGKTVVIASHGCAIRNLICRVLYNDINRLSEIGWSENTAVSKLIFDDDMQVAAEYIFDASHLPPEYIPENSKMKNMLGEKQ